MEKRLCQSHPKPLCGAGESHCTAQIYYYINKERNIYIYAQLLPVKPVPATPVPGCPNPRGPGQMRKAHSPAISHPARHPTSSSSSFSLRLSLPHTSSFSVAAATNSTSPSPLPSFRISITAMGKDPVRVLVTGAAGTFFSRCFLSFFACFTLFSVPAYNHQRYVVRFARYSLVWIWIRGQKRRFQEFFLVFGSCCCCCCPIL